MASDQAASGASWACTHASSSTTSAPLRRPAVVSRWVARRRRCTSRRRWEGTATSSHSPPTLGRTADRGIDRPATPDATLGLSHPNCPRIVTPREQTRRYEDPPPTCRPAQPPPGGALRGRRTLAVVVRLRRTRVLLTRRVAQRLHRRARPPEPGARGVAVRPGDTQRVPGPYRRRDRRLLLSPGGADGATTHVGHGVALLQGGPWPRVLRAGSGSRSRAPCPRRSLVTAASPTRLTAAPLPGGPGIGSGRRALCSDVMK